ncbi:MAG: haloalkane dehalogenase [Acidimicrobiales bacterium]|nr:haloalkane dehalogenase [Acidimicrobiales bacterium]
MEIVRTPDERFVDLPGYPFEPHYEDLEGPVRIHYLDEGAKDANPVLLMHGEPSWSYLYRRVIPPLAKAKHRVIAPDLIGFGRSDKPVDQSDYTYARHVKWLHELVFEKLNLKNITLFCQDWGGLIGLRLVASHPECFDRVIVANTGLPTGEEKLSDAFFAWQKFSQESVDFPVGQIISMGCFSKLSSEVIAAYDAPFPDDKYKAGARRFPMLVPSSPNDPEHDANVAAWEVLKNFDKPWLCSFSDKDPITKGTDRIFFELIPGTKSIDPITIHDGGHFLQEDKGEDVAQVIDTFIKSTS